jgi:NagD protein
MTWSPIVQELQQKLARMGIRVTEDHFYTCETVSDVLNDNPHYGVHSAALSTAAFLARQKPGGSCFVIGEGG